MFLQFDKLKNVVIYSIVETAKVNGLNAFKYLTHLFEAFLNINFF
ncbi:transposase domain-containing protein [Enterococcus rivorum]